MKILIIVTLSELGGAQSVAVNLANYLAEDNDVIFAAGRGDGKIWNMLNSKIKKIPLKHLDRKISVKNDPLALWELIKLNKKLKPDIVHLHSSKAGILGRLAFPRKKIVYTVHGFDSIRLAYRKFLPIERMLQKRCSAIVGVSKYDVENLLKERIYNNVKLVYNGIKKPSELKNDPFEDLSNYKAKILCIARLIPQKNHKLFIEVARLLPDYAFIWIGNQDLPNMDIPNNVFFKGNISNAGSYCNYVDLFLLTSNYEGLPIVIIEAMSFALPVVASDVGGIKEIVENDVNGFVLPNDAELMAKKISDILSDETTKTKFGNSGKEKYERDLTIAKMSEGYLNIYKELYNKNNT